MLDWVVCACGGAAVYAAGRWLATALQGRKKRKRAGRHGTPLKVVVSQCEARWFLEALKSAMAGDSEAMVTVSHMLMAGYGTKQDSHAAAAWMRQAWAIQNYKEPALLHDMLDVRDSPVPALNEAATARRPQAAAAAAAAQAAMSASMVPSVQQQQSTAASSNSSSSTRGGGGGPAAAPAGAGGAAPAASSHAAAAPGVASSSSCRSSQTGERGVPGSSSCSSSPSQERQQQQQEEEARAAAGAVAVRLGKVRWARQQALQHLQQQRRALAAVADAAAGSQVADAAAGIQAPRQAQQQQQQPGVDAWYQFAEQC